MSFDAKEFDHSKRFFRGSIPDFRYHTLAFSFLLPFAILFVGWRIAGMGVGPKNEESWDSAGTLILWVTAAATLAGALYWSRLFREAMPIYQLLLGAGGFVYLAALILFNFYAYTSAGGPFP